MPPTAARSEGLPPQARADVEPAILQAETNALKFAFRGYVAVVFPIGPENGCVVDAHKVIEVTRNSYRSVYEIDVVARCLKIQVEPYKVHFQCRQRNEMQCSIISILDPTP